MGYLRASVVPFLAALAIMSVAMFCFQSIYQVMLALYIRISGGPGKSSEGEALFQEVISGMSGDVNYFISVSSVLICGIVFYFWYRREVSGQQRRRLLSIIKGKNLYFFVMLGIGCQLFFSGVMSLLQPVFPEQFEDYSETMGSILGSNPLLVIIYMIVIAPVTEELIFRGVILERMRKAVPFLGANLLQALFFGIYHGNIIQGIYASVMGFLLGLFCHRFRSLSASILLHMIINSSVVVVMLFPASAVSYIIMAVAGAGACVLSFRRLELWKEGSIQ